VLCHDRRQPLSLIFGAANMCIAVHPSDIAPALIALNAKIVTDTRTIDAENFWDVKKPGNTVLASGEIITEIRIRRLRPALKAPFSVCHSQVDRFPDRELRRDGRRRGSPDCFERRGAKPYRATKAEAAIAGKPINEANAEAAGAAAVADAKPFAATKYKVQIAKTLVKRALLAAV